MPRDRSESFVRVALVLPTEFAYARGVLRGIIAATRERNLYAGALPARGDGIVDAAAAGAAAGAGRGGTRPWLFRIYRGIYGHSSKYLAARFREWDPQGIICQIYDDRLAKVYRDTGVPVVELFESRGESEFPRILPDDVATGALAARHFIERGFRHFGFFGANWMIWSRERSEGFRAEIERTFRARGRGGGGGRGGAAAAAAARTFTFASYGPSGDGGSRAADSPAAFDGSHKKRAAAMGTWLASLPRPLALFAANDLWGFELIQAARELGLRVPDDVAVLGVDNEELLCEIAHPPLSSIRMGAERIGREAVTLLDRLLRRPPQARASGASRASRSSRASASSRVSRVPPMEVVTRQSTDVLAVEDPDVAAALSHIRQHATEGLSVKQMLEAVAVNRRTLERRFVSILGHTPLEEIRRIRIERARALLQTDLPVYDVASRSGFGSPEYLATSFLHATGMTPTAFRRQFTPTSRWHRLPPA